MSTSVLLLQVSRGLPKGPVRFGWGYLKASLNGLVRFSFQAVRFWVYKFNV